jgi:hypothetical protein
MQKLFQLHIFLITRYSQKQATEAGITDGHDADTVRITIEYDKLY